MSPNPKTSVPPNGEASLEVGRPVWVLATGIGLVIVCALAFCLAAALILLSPSPAVPVTVMIAGSATQVQTTGHTVADVLKELQLSVNPGDNLSPPAESTLSANVIIQLERARAVTVTIDGQSQTFQTLFTNPLDILNSLGITPGANDKVIVDGTETDFADLLVWPVPVAQIIVQHAASVTINDDGQITTIETTHSTVGEALYEAGITLYLADSVTPELNAPISTGLTVSIHRSQPVTIIADGVTLETRTRGHTIADALISANVPLMGLDYAIPAESAPLEPGMTIRVIRVTEQVETEQGVIPFETLYQADPDLELDQQVTLQEGQNGIQRSSIRIRYENGIEVSRANEGTTIALNPISRIIGYGTKIVIRTLDTPDGPRDYWRKLRMYATSYHPAALGGDNITATGRLLTKGVVGIDPKVIPYGTELYVPDYGAGIAADTGGPRRIKLWIDLGYDDGNWVSWSKYVDVYLLTPVPDNILYVLPE
jgi:resuscitation-promoting factor RpfB